MRRLTPTLAVLLVGVALLAAPAFAPSEPETSPESGDGHADDFGLVAGLLGLVRAFVGSLYAAVGVVAVGVVLAGLRRESRPPLRFVVVLAVAATTLAAAFTAADPWPESQLNGAIGAWFAFLPFASLFAVGTRREGWCDPRGAAAVVAGVVGLVAFGIDANGALDLVAGGVFALFAVAVVGGPLYAVGRSLST